MHVTYPNPMVPDNPTVYCCFLLEFCFQPDGSASAQPENKPTFLHLISFTLSFWVFFFFSFNAINIDVVIIAVYIMIPIMLSIISTAKPSKKKIIFPKIKKKVNG